MANASRPILLPPGLDNKEFHWSRPPKGFLAGDSW
jgi:hypothetical protein